MFGTRAGLTGAAAAAAAGGGGALGLGLKGCLFLLMSLNLCLRGLTAGLGGAWVVGTVAATSTTGTWLRRSTPLVTVGAAVGLRGEYSKFLIDQKQWISAPKFFFRRKEGNIAQTKVDFDKLP